MKITTQITQTEFDTEAHTYEEARMFEKEFWQEMRLKKWKLRLLYWLKKLSRN
jgi:hypothetical protein